DQWRGGFASRMGGHHRDECPFAAETPERIDWLAGWDAGDFDDAAPKLGEKPAEGVVSEAPAGGDQADPEPEETPEDAGETGGDETDPPHDPETGEIVEEEPDLDAITEA